MRKYPLLGLAAASLLALSACGGGNEPPPRPQPTQTQSEEPSAEPSEDSNSSSSDSSDEMVIDEVMVQDSIAETIEEATGVAPTDVTCPEGVSVKAGNTFQCSVDIEDQTLLMDVTQENDEGDLTYAEADGQIILSYDEISDELTEAAYRAVEDGELTVPDTSSALAGVCVFPRGEDVYIARVGEELECAIADEDDNAIGVIGTVEEDGTLAYAWAE